MDVIITAIMLANIPMDVIITTLVSVITAIMLAAIPWAFSIHGRLSHIEAVVEATRANVVDDITQNSREIRELWKQIAEVKDRIKVENTQRNHTS